MAFKSNKQSKEQTTQLPNKRFSSLEKSPPKKRRRKTIEFREHKFARITSFHKRKEGFFKKAHELVRLTGCEILIFLMSETGQVYAYSSNKFKPIISSQKGIQLIEQCLNEPDPCIELLPTDQ
jgi:pheromone receptor transcription factor